MKVDPSKDWELMEHPVQTMRPLFIHWISRAADDIANHPEEKVERWEVLKNTTVARCAARVYCSVALALLLRVQLSVLAGQMYLETVRKKKCKTVSKNVQAGRGILQLGRWAVEFQGGPTGNYEL